jgi:hypothetical protein
MIPTLTNPDIVIYRQYRYLIDHDYIIIDPINHEVWSTVSPVGECGYIQLHTKVELRKAYKHIVTDYLKTGYPHSQFINGKNLQIALSYLPVRV